MKEDAVQETIFTCDVCPKGEVATVKMLPTRSAHPERWASVVISLDDLDFYIHVCEDCLLDREAIGAIASIVADRRQQVPAMVMMKTETSRKRRGRS